LLVKHLSWHVDSWQPASITRVWVIPANHILQPPSLCKWRANEVRFNINWRMTECVNYIQGAFQTNFALHWCEETGN
jgi:hypothetical protein